MEKKRTSSFTALCALTVLLGSCESVSQTPPQNAASLASEKNVKGMPGISGMAAYSKDSFLVVHDAKAHKPDKPRLGLLYRDHQGQKMRYTGIPFPDAVSTPTSDLEDICAIPGLPGEFLVNESGTFEMRYGRLFHIKTDGAKAEHEKTLKMPFTSDNSEHGPEGDQFEGMACALRSDGRVLVIVGDRGGVSHKPFGTLRWGVYDLQSKALSWSEASMQVDAPNPFGDPKLRSITALDIDEYGFLYASASVDSGSDLGPFRSIVYRIGRIESDAELPIVPMHSKNYWVLDGLKVKGVETLGSLSIGAEDENLGGVWRALAPTPISK